MVCPGRHFRYVDFHVDLVICAWLMSANCLYRDGPIATLVSLEDESKHRYILFDKIGSGNNFASIF
jgi:hypothetical protein